MKERTMKHGFTLAEVLITLTIIGVIAALTIPNLMNKYQDHVQLNAFKKAYSVLQNAFRMAIAENGPLDEWAWPKETSAYETTNGDYLGEKLKPYLKISKYCGSSNECWQYKNNEYKGVSGTIINFKPSWKGGKMILDDGLTIAISFNNTSQLTTRINSDNQILIDTNGKKGPNTVGYDIFYISFNRNGLTQYGNYWGATADSCNPTVTTYTKDDGAGCTYWILKHNNMDYKYRDISAEW